jgi:hypothetical protein
VTRRIAPTRPPAAEAPADSTSQAVAPTPGGGYPKN